MGIPNTVGFKGRGPVRVAPFQKPGNMQRLGNNSTLELAYETTDEEMQDYEGLGGGIIESDSEISNVTMGLNLTQFSDLSLAVGMRGTSRDQDTAQITDEAHRGYPGGVNVLAASPDAGQAVSVTQGGGTWAAATDYQAATDTLEASFIYAGTHIYECIVAGTSSGVEPTWPTDGSSVVDGTVTWQDRGDVSTLNKDADWGVTRAGISIIDGGKIVAGMPINVTYFPDSGVKLIDALKDAAREWRLVFDGMNRLRDNRPCVIVVWRAKATPGSTNFISESFGEMPLSFSVLKDESIPETDPTSQYFQIRWKDAA